MDVFCIGPLRAYVALAAAVAALSFVGAPVGAAESGNGSVVSRYSNMLASSNGRLSPSERQVLAERVLLLSSYYELDPRLLIALVSVESAWRTHAMSPVGARGLGQLMPGTAAALNVNAFETYENLDGTARYLRRLLMRFPNYTQRVRYRYALAAYNAGPGAVDRFHGVPPYAETQSYVTHVMALWDRFTHSAAIPSRAALALVQPAPVASHHSAYVKPRPSRTTAAIAYAPAPATIYAFAASPAPVPVPTTQEAPPRRGLFAFLHRRRKAASPQTTPPEGDYAIAAQSAFLPAMPHSALRHF
jgi:hypothetical protein